MAIEVLIISIFGIVWFVVVFFQSCGWLLSICFNFESEADAIESTFVEFNHYPIVDIESAILLSPSDNNKILPEANPIMLNGFLHYSTFENDLQRIY